MVWWKCDPSESSGGGTNFKGDSINMQMKNQAKPLQNTNSFFTCRHTLFYHGTAQQLQLQIEQQGPSIQTDGMGLCACPYRGRTYFVVVCLNTEMSICAHAPLAHIPRARVLDVPKAPTFIIMSNSANVTIYFSIASSFQFSYKNVTTAVLMVYDCIAARPMSKDVVKRMSWKVCLEQRTT